mmetsp:Transcript_37497/g.96992  ORF Transcript_37497/g.96992 Transcript_37497/m.96992 type:complete len:521 (+) Transcript_37497:74-1636(+)
MAPFAEQATHEEHPSADPEVALAPGSDLGCVGVRAVPPRSGWRWGLAGGSILLMAGLVCLSVAAPGGSLALSPRRLGRRSPRGPGRRPRPPPPPPSTPPPTLSTTAATTPTTTQSTTSGDSNQQWPEQVMTCPGIAATTTQSMTCADYDAAVASVQALYDSLPNTCSAAACPQADWAGCVLRMAGHDLMDFKDNQGGADGCIDLHDPDNKGLAECLHTGEHGVSILTAYHAHCTQISLADFLVIAAEAVMLSSRKHVTDADNARRDIDFRSSFRYGRSTAATCPWSQGRLPNPERSCTAVEETFVDNMGLSWSESAALMGVHTLGRARIENSGYDGFWSDAENSRRFNNNYFASIVGKGWTSQTAVDGNPNKNQWVRSDQARNGPLEMMLNTDLCLAYTEDNNGRQELNAQTSGCCAWSAATPDVQAAVRGHLDGLYCGGNNIPRGRGDQRAACCSGQRNRAIDCGSADDLAGPAAQDVLTFARDEGSWLDRFEQAWKKATENGYATESGESSLHSLQCS